jgi:signal transduction histidine kinase
MSRGDARIKLAGLPVALTSRSFVQLVIIAVILGFAAVAMAGAAAVLAISRDQVLTQRVQHTNKVHDEIANFRTLLERSETARRGYLLSGEPSFAQTYRDTTALLPQSLQRLGELTGDNAGQQQRLAELGVQLGPHLADSRLSVDLVRRGGQVMAIRGFLAERASQRMPRIRALLTAMTQEESRLLASREALQRESVRNLYLSMAVAGPLLLLLAVGSTFVIFRYTRDLATAGEALAVLNEGLEQAVAERTAGLARANDEIQRFAYIVSHDLRSPLVNVMGFTAEMETSVKPLSALVERVEDAAPALLTAEAKDAVRTEIPEAIGFIRTSTQKMDRLINAILDLSRNGRRTLRPERLDMTNVLSDVAATLKIAAEDGDAEIVVAPALPAIVSDRLAIEQVFANLIENAIKYRRSDVPARIEITGSTRPGWCIFEVTDNGRGVDPKDHERVFELFRRAGVQDRPGEGIGLANVRAIVYRLRGNIEIDSALDQGSTFRVLLPPLLRADQETAS